MSDFKRAKGCEVLVFKAGQSGYDKSVEHLKHKRIAIAYGHQEFESQRKLARHLGLSDSTMSRYVKIGHHKGVSITKVEER